MSAASFRLRYLLGILCHAVLALFGCAGHPDAFVASPEVLGICGARPSFAESTTLKRWKKFPVSVYVDASAVPESARATYRAAIERGLGLWAEATRGRIGAFDVNGDRPESPIHVSIAEAPLPDDALGSTELTFTGNRIVSATVLLTRSRFESTELLVDDVASTTAHEIGHVLGIVDHSPHPEDKMWVSGNFGTDDEGLDPSSLITPRDVNTLREAYCRP